MLARVSVSMLWTVLGNLERRHVPYGFDDKAPSLGCPTSDISSIDCSGFVRYELARATLGKLIVPDGSVNMHDWFEQQAEADPISVRKLDRYSDVQYAAEDPSRLFVCFIAPRGGEPGHVWLVNAGKTLESHGHAGPSSRPWDEPVLHDNACAAYELETC